MDFIEWTIRTIDNIAKHGLNIKIIFLSIITLYNVTLVRKMVRRRIPKKWRHEDRLEIVERKIDALAAHMGVPECVERKGLLPSTARLSSKSYTKERYFVRIAAWFTVKESTTYSRRKKKMKKWYTSRKFLITIATGVLVALNDALGWGLSQPTITTIAGVVVGWVASEAATDIVKKKTDVTNDYTNPTDAGNV